MDDLQFIIRAKNEAKAGFAEIQADAAKANATMSGLNTAGTAEAKKAAGERLLAVKTSNAAIRTDTRLTAQLIEQEFGVRMPRAINTFLSRMPALQNAIGKAMGPAVGGAVAGMLLVGLEAVGTKIIEFQTNLGWESGKSFGEAWLNAYIGVNAKAQEAAFKHSNELAAKLIEKQREENARYGTQVAPGVFVSSRGSSISTPFGNVDVSDAAKLNVKYREQFNQDAYKLSREYGAIEDKTPEVTGAFQEQLRDKAAKALREQTDEQVRLNRENEHAVESMRLYRVALAETNRIMAEGSGHAFPNPTYPRKWEIGEGGVSMNQISSPGTNILMGQLRQAQVDAIEAENVWSQFVKYLASETKVLDIGMPVKSDESTIGEKLAEKNAEAIQRLKDLVDQGREAGKLIAEGAAQFRKEVEQMGQRVFDALWAGKTGMIELLKSALKSPARTMFGNLTGVLFGKMGGSLGGAIGGQVQKDPVTGKDVYNDDGTVKLTKLGEILKGTPLGVDVKRLEAQRVIDNANLREKARFTQHDTTNQLLQQIIDGSKTASAGASSSGSTMGGLGSLLGGIGGLLGGLGGLTGTGGTGGFGALANAGFGGSGGIFGGSGGILGTILGKLGIGGGSGSGSGAAGGLLGSFGSILGKVLPGAMAATLGSTIGRDLGGKTGSIVGGVIGGAGVGFMTGGPIGAAVGAGIGLLEGLLGGNGVSVADRQKQIAAMLNNDRVSMPSPMHSTFAIGGGGVDYGFGGMARSVAGATMADSGSNPFSLGYQPYGAPPNVKTGSPAGFGDLHIHAMDAQSIIDRADDIVAAVRSRLTLGHSALSNDLRGFV